MSSLNVTIDVIVSTLNQVSNKFEKMNVNIISSMKLIDVVTYDFRLIGTIIKVLIKIITIVTIEFVRDSYEQNKQIIPRVNLSGNQFDKFLIIKILRHMFKF